MIPADRLSSLRIPALAVDTGGPDPVWVDIPLGGVAGSGTMRVPLAARSVKQAGRRLLEFRYRPLVGWLLFAAYLVAAEVFVRSDGGPWYGAWILGFIGAWSVISRRRPEQVPYRTYRGEVVLPEMDPATARQWTELNPDVRMTGKTVTRAHAPRFYAVWAVVLLLLGSIGAGVLLANDGHEQSVAVWFALPVIFVSGVRTARRIRPHRALRYAR
ncbi:hypothetical protein ADL15_08515 [Actinoplanes awajinensis subsp. mycoplanecinus]|uniref:Uncharacterized protein n=1 Tax=Actinoplanes awajinensis subsp. mycoplanecinus TaxID=135947 RepID=A0A0X3V6T8_9ACTN|nr:hypothetical protein ADL15_08515 [Actinoplanes awajinensis subsp. mycoplanecinus]